MINSIQNLSPEDQQLLRDAVPYVTLLVAGADGIIDDAELAAGEKVAHVRSFQFHPEWMEFYKAIDGGLHDRMLALINELPRATEARQAELTARLSGLNKVLAKLDRRHARHFYEGLLSLAEHTAKASGGFIGWLTIGPKEAKVTDLPMIDPIQ
ncbi:hypothetical protein [Phaeodactylibacter luteus]|uniref:Uncharacterized protein n=1 Tax=Phaeodactylibacter luteus TaxID=1564516 RepID=A0A5C6RGF3_9BACT|nr:hypothetical protein [Phaeodactylibacter luteus]TXB61518.1 hypothetical protein FRY97_18630 [Phaeodactylibacter luteus]